MRRRRRGEGDDGRRGHLRLHSASRRRNPRRRKRCALLSLKSTQHREVDRGLALRPQGCSVRECRTNLLFSRPPGADSVSEMTTSCTWKCCPRQPSGLSHVEALRVSRTSGEPQSDRSIRWELKGGGASILRLRIDRTTRVRPTSALFRTYRSFIPIKRHQTSVCHEVLPHAARFTRFICTPGVSLGLL